MSAPRTGVRLTALLAFALAMGWLEAVVVVYIRALLGIAHGNAVVDPAELTRRLATLPWLVPTEQGREAATVVMLAAAGWLAAPRFLPRFGAFLVAFGVWDITFYAALYAMLRWPPGLGTMDLLFLIPPGPWWVQPVWVPVAISCVMIAVGLWLFSRPAAARQERPDPVA